MLNRKHELSEKININLNKINTQLLIELSVVVYI